MFKRLTLLKGKPMNDPLSIKGLPLLLKIIASVICAILSLILSGDIDT